MVNANLIMAYQQLNDQTDAPRETETHQCTIQPLTCQQHLNVVAWIVSHNNEIRAFSIDPVGTIRIVFEVGSLGKGLEGLEELGVIPRIKDIYLTKLDQMVIPSGHVIRYAYATKDGYYVVGTQQKSCSMM